jgi:hypothetical protein
MRTAKTRGPRHWLIEVCAFFDLVVRCVGSGATALITMHGVRRASRSPGKERITIAYRACTLPHAEAPGLGPLNEVGTALDAAGNGRHACKVVGSSSTEQTRLLTSRPIRRIPYGDVLQAGPGGARPTVVADRRYQTTSLSKPPYSACQTVSADADVGLFLAGRSDSCPAVELASEPSSRSPATGSITN